MIYDRIENAKCYYGMGKGIEKALKFLESYDVSKHTPGKIEIEGDQIFANCMSYENHTPEGALIEAHKDYIDVMFVAEGEEKFFFKPIAECEKITKPYDPSIEAALAEIDADATPCRFKANHFAIFLPQDGHCAGLRYDEAVNVKKVIVKVNMKTL